MLATLAVADVEDGRQGEQRGDQAASAADGDVETHGRRGVRRRRQ